MPRAVCNEMAPRLRAQDIGRRRTRPTLRLGYQLHVMLVFLSGAARTDIKAKIRSLVGKKAAFDNC